MPLHLLAHPYLLAAGGATALGLLGYGLMKKRGAASGLSAAEAKRAAALKAAYASGNKAGKADGLADAGKDYNPRPIFCSADAAEQQQCENGYNDGYESKWVAPAVTPDVVPDVVKPGGSKGMSAYRYGESRGLSAGRQAANDGVDGGAVKGLIASNLASSGSIARQKESGDPAEYRRGYTNGFGGGYAARQGEIAAGGLFGVFGLGHFNGHATSGFKGAVAGFMVAGFPGAVVGATALPVIVEARRHGLVPARYHAMVRGLPAAVTGAAGGFVVAGIPGAFVGAVALPVVALIRDRFRSSATAAPYAIDFARGRKDGWECCEVNRGKPVSCVPVGIRSKAYTNGYAAGVRECQASSAQNMHGVSGEATKVGGRESRRSMLSRRGAPA